MMASKVTPAQFTEWRKYMGWEKGVTAKRLGLGSSAISLYERGARYDDYPFQGIPLVVALAMAALANGLKPYGE